MSSRFVLTFPIGSDNTMAQVLSRLSKSFTVSRTGGMRIHYLRSKPEWNFRMKRTVLFTLLVALSVPWSIPAKAQSPGVAEYARQSMVAAKKQQKTYRKAAKKQQKAMKKYEKAQRNAAKKEAKKTNRHA